MGKNKKYRRWLGDDSYDASRVEDPNPVYDHIEQLTQVQDTEGIPQELILGSVNGQGVVFGVKHGSYKDFIIGMPQGEEGNIAVIGGNGSGKSASIAEPTLRTWRKAMCATDIKGELSKFYAKLYRQGLVTRPFIIFDPLQVDGIGYDPFYWVEEDKDENRIKNIWEITLAIMPNMHTGTDPFWRDSEQAILAAALLYYFELGLSFSQAIIMIMSSSVTSLYKKLGAEENAKIKAILGEGVDMKPETLASIDRGFRNKLMLFAIDPYIVHALRGKRERASCFTWDDLDHYNIFLHIPEDRIEQWSGAVNLMYTQLIRHLERRPDKYSSGGTDNIQTLLLMDEFARFGKLEMITNAMSTLRSKSVNICLILQSMAQLDKIYGEYDRRIILDNCQFQVILRANDAETQNYLSNLIGTRQSTQQSFSESFDEFGNNVGCGRQISEAREPIIYPHELATLKDVLLLTPYGFCRVEKYRTYSNAQEKMSLAASNIIQATYVSLPESETFIRAISAESDFDKENRVIVTKVKALPLGEEIANENFKHHIDIDTSSMMQCNVEDKGGTTKMMSIEEKTAKTKEIVVKLEQQKRLEQKKAREEKSKKDQRRNYVIGELVTKYFPEALNFNPGTKDENAVIFEPLEAFLSELAADQELMKTLRERATMKITQRTN